MHFKGGGAQRAIPKGYKGVPAPPPPPRKLNEMLITYMIMIE